MTGKRRRAREMAVQMLYQQEMGGSSLDQVFASFEPEGFIDEAAALDGDDDPDPASRSTAATRQGESRKRCLEAFGHARQLVSGTLERRAELDELIRRQALNWRLERMPTIDRNILRLALYEMFYGQGVPKIVVLDEAIELAKKFGSEDSSRFINGLLDGILSSQDSVRVAPTPGGRST